MESIEAASIGAKVRMSRTRLALGLMACLFMATGAVAVMDNVVKGTGISVDRMLSSMNVQPGNLKFESLGRALLQAEDDEFAVPDCAWNEDTQTCGLFPLVAVDLLAQAPPSPVKDLIVGVVVCTLSPTEEICVSNDGCTWSGEVCVPEVDISDKETISSCMGKEAAVFLEGGARYIYCSETYDSEDACNIDDDCSWIEHRDGGRCQFDVWKFLTGVPSDQKLPRGLPAVMGIRAAELATAVELAGISTPDDVLDFEVPPFACPSAVDLVVCNIAATGDELMLTQLYCELRFEQDGICDEDILCATADSQCGPSAEIRLDVELQQREVYISAIRDPVAANLLRKELFCLGRRESSCDDDCAWSPESETCSLSPNLVMKELSNESVQRPGPICQVVQSLFKTGCLQFEDEEACSARDQCLWDDADELCAPGPQAYMDILFSGERHLQREMVELAVSCGLKTTERQCNN